MASTGSSHSFCPNDVDTIAANNDTWDSGYPNNAWTNTSFYPAPGTPIATEGPWLQQALSNKPHSNVPLIAGQSPTMMAPSSSYHPDRTHWPIASPNGYIPPDTHATIHPSNAVLRTPMNRIPSSNSSPEELSDTVSCGTSCSHGTGLHSSQVTGIEYVFPRGFYHHNYF